jgi:hypothetical protein
MPTVTIHDFDFPHGATRGDLPWILTLKQIAYLWKGTRAIKLCAGHAGLSPLVEDHMYPREAAAVAELIRELEKAARTGELHVMHLHVVREEPVLYTSADMTADNLGAAPTEFAAYLQKTGGWPLADGGLLHRWFEQWKEEIRAPQTDRARSKPRRPRAPDRWGELVAEACTTLKRRFPGQEPTAKAVSDYLEALEDPRIERDGYGKLWFLDDKMKPLTPRALQARLRRLRLKAKAEGKKTRRPRTSRAH